jgi:hypothetical protein
MLPFFPRVILLSSVPHKAAVFDHCLVLPVQEQFDQRTKGGGADGSANTRYTGGIGDNAGGSCEDLPD